MNNNLKRNDSLLLNEEWQSPEIFDLRFLPVKVVLVQFGTICKDKKRMRVNNVRIGIHFEF